jgi:hypothetical protein
LKEGQFQLFDMPLRGLMEIRSLGSGETSHEIEKGWGRSEILRAKDCCVSLSLCFFFEILQIDSAIIRGKTVA